MAKDDKKDAGPPRNFGVFLAQMEEGGLVEDLSAELVRANVELSKHAEHNWKARGQITVVIDLAYQANGTRVKDGSVTWFLAMFKPERLVDSARLTPHDERRVAVLSQTDTRTVRRFLEGKPGRLMTAARIRDTLSKLEAQGETMLPVEEHRP